MKIATRLSNKALPTLVTLSLLLFIITTLATPRIDASSDIFLYVKSLPITYWIGLTLSVLTLVWGGRWSRFAVISSTVLITCYLFVLPSIAYVNYPGSRDAYGHMSYALYISNVGHVDGIGVGRFPGSYIFTATIHLVAGIEPLNILKVYNPAYILFIALIAYLMARRIGGRECAYIAPLAILGLYWSCMYFGKSTYAYMLWAILWLLLLMLVEHRETKTAILTILAYSALTISHPLSSFLIFPIMLLYIMLSCLLKKGEKLRLSSFILFTTIWCSWYIVTGFFIMPIIGSLRNVYELLLHEIHEPLHSPIKYTAAYSTNYLKVVYLRTFSSLFVLTTGTILSAIAIFKRHSNSILLLTSSILSLIGLFASPFSRLSLANLNRAVEHSLILYVSLLSVTTKFVSSSKRGAIKFYKVSITYLIPLVLIDSMFLMPVTSYTSSAPFMHVPTPSLKMADFIATRYSPDRDAILNSLSFGMEYYTILRNNYLLHLKVQSQEGLHKLYYDNWDNVPSTIKKYEMIVVEYKYFVEDTFWAYDPPFSKFLRGLVNYLNTSPDFNKVYANSQYCSVYIKSDK